MAQLFTSLPRHLYCHVEREFLGEEIGLERASWFGLTSITGRAWGLSLLLENGAIYSHVPPHAIVFDWREGNSLWKWPLRSSQLWDCHGYDFAVHEYEQLAGRDVVVRIRNHVRPKAWAEHEGVYLFTAQHYGDGYSRVPEQAKQYHFCKLNLGRLVAVPANHLLVHDTAFTCITGWPKWLRRQTEAYYAEEQPD